MWIIDFQEHVSWLWCYSCDTGTSMCRLSLLMSPGSWKASSIWTRSRWNSSDQFIASCILYSVSAEQSWWEHCHWHSDPGLWAKPGVKMGSWGYPRGPWQTSGLLPQPHLNMNEIGICRNFMNVDTENQSVFHWICLRLPASGVAGAARNEWVQPSFPDNLNKIAHLYLSIFTSVVYLVFFHCVFATISIAKTS